jgi:hypothetical protein
MMVSPRLMRRRGRSGLSTSILRDLVVIRVVEIAIMAGRVVVIAGAMLGAGRRTIIATKIVVDVVVTVLPVPVVFPMILVDRHMTMLLWGVVAVILRSHDMMMVIGSLAGVVVRNPVLLIASLHVVVDGMLVTCLMAAVEDLDGSRLAGWITMWTNHWTVVA